MNDTVGIFYELPSGKIAKTFGFMERGKIIRYYFDDDHGTRYINNDIFQTWIPRRDLTDFPNAKNPRLHKEFDTRWDFKFMSQLRNGMNNHPDKINILECIKRHKIEKWMGEWMEEHWS